MGTDRWKRGIIPPCMNDPQPEGHMASYLGRRKFLATLGGAAAWPLAASIASVAAQPYGRKSRSAAVSCRTEVCYPLRPEAWEGPGSEPALVHHAVRRRSSCVAARGARAAARTDTPYCVLARAGGQRSGRKGPRRCVSGRARVTRMDGESQRQDR